MPRSSGGFLVVLAALACALCAPAIANAADINVTSCDELALKTAIGGAHDGDVVHIACDGTIPLQSHNPIEIHAAITLDATGHQVTINGGNRSRVLFISTPGTVTLRGFGITAGSGPGGPGGGGVFDAGTQLVVDHMRFVGNYSDDKGGAISVVGTTGSLHVTDSVFDGNSVACGPPTCNRDGGGGAINTVSGGGAVIERSTFTNNSTTGQGSGGAVLAGLRFMSQPGGLTIRDSHFDHNVATTAFTNASYPALGGGAAAAINQPLTIERSTFADNQSVPLGGGVQSEGGAVRVAGQNDPMFPVGPSSISDSTFQDNLAGGPGGRGGAISETSTDLTIARSRVAGSEAESGGGVSNSGGTIEVSDSTLTGNRARGGVNGAGGALWTTGKVTVTGSDVTANTPDGCLADNSGSVVDGGDNFESPGTSCGFAQATGPQLSVADLSVGEPETGETTDATATVKLSAPLRTPLTFHWTTVADGTATPGQDFKADAGDVTIPAGATTAQVPVTVIGDDTPEPNETFGLQLSLPEPSRTTLAGTGHATVTIADDDTPAPAPITPTPPAAPAPAPPAAGGQDAAASVPAPTGCASRRRVTVYPGRFKGLDGARVLSAARLTSSGKLMGIPHTRSTVTVDLRSLPAGTYTVHIRVRLRSGERRTLIRHYATCVPF